MDEVDKIIIESLISIGCEIDSDITNIGQFDQNLVIESVAKLLNQINSATNSSAETLPTKLPPSTAVRFRIGTKLATVCQSLGYKNEIGYQTFLYSNEAELRKLLIFLVEILNKETSKSTLADQNSLSSNKKKNLNLVISDKVKNLLDQFWLPPYLKLNSLRPNENKSFSPEGCSFKSNFNAVKLEVPLNLTNNKSKYSKNLLEYFNNYSNYVTSQTNKSNLLTSLIQINTLERLKENSMFKADLSVKKDQNKKNLEELKQILKKNVKQILDASSKFLLTEKDLLEIEASIQNQTVKNYIKGSRFQHSEKLQFTTQESSQNVSVVTNNSEEKKDQEINDLKQKLENLNQNFDSIQREIDTFRNETILQAQNKTQEQTSLIKSVQESIALKKKTVNLINDAPMNILKLKEEINSHEKRMENLRDKWTSHKLSLEEKKEALKQEILNQNSQMEQKLEETKQLRMQINEFNTELSAKEAILDELSKELEQLVKTSSKSPNRQFYVKRILEICSNIDKQRKEIDKILIDTRAIQKDLNQLSGKLERIFNATDELLFKDAKQSEVNKKVYKLFVNINSDYEKMLESLEQTSQLDRECRDLEDQVDLEVQNKVSDNMAKVMDDLKQVKQENQQLISLIKTK